MMCLNRVLRFHWLKNCCRLIAWLINPLAVEVILLSRNSADTGLRIFNSIKHHQLDITRAAFYQWSISVIVYVPAFGAHLFLSADAGDVKNALDTGYAAATILSSSPTTSESKQLRIAFDGDAVLFSDESERVYKEEGLTAFTKNEQQQANKPLTGGPFKPFLSALQGIQAQIRA